MSSAAQEGVCIGRHQKHDLLSTACAAQACIATRKRQESIRRQKRCAGKARQKSIAPSGKCSVSAQGRISLCAILLTRTLMKAWCATHGP